MARSKAHTRFELRGVATVMRNLNTVLNATKKNMQPALIECGIVVRRSMAFDGTKVPMDTRNLEHSWFITTAKQTKGNNPMFVGKGSGQLSADHSALISDSKTRTMMTRMPAMVMGFSARYAAYVHEMPSSTKWTRQGSGPKFFEEAVKRNETRMLEILKRYAKLK